MRKIKVMHVLCMNSYSGAENVVITLINSLKKRVDSVYVSPDGSIREIVESYGIKHYAIEKVSVTNIRKAIKDIKPDIIQAHDFTAGIICAVAANGIPVINHLHNNSPWIKRYSVKSFLYALTCFRFKKILTVSDSVMDEFVFGKWFVKKTTVIGNPIDLSVILNKAESSEKCDESDIIFLGRLVAQKNPLLFIDIVAEIVKNNPEIRIAIVGDGDLRKDVQDKIMEYGISQNVKLYGFQANPYGLLSKSKVMCMPSNWEGFGLAAVEALALGKPVVASPVGGLKNIVNNECGKLCKRKEEYAKELEELLTDETYYRKKACAAKKRAYEYDNILSYSEKIEKIYASVARNRIVE